MIYLYRKRLPQTREEHSVVYTSEVYSDLAITIAFTRKQAIKRFSALYMDVKPSQVIGITKKLFICLLKGWVLLLTDHADY